MKFWARYVAATLVAAAVDGAFLGGVAAIMSCFVTLILGLLAHRRGTQEGRVAAEAEAAKWKLVAEQRETERLELLELVRAHGHDDPADPGNPRRRRPRRRGT